MKTLPLLIGLLLLAASVQAQTSKAPVVERFFTTKEVDERLRLLKRPEPSYTDEAKAKGFKGIVVLVAVFSSTGEVRDITVVSGLPYGLTGKAIEAAGKIKFSPAIKDGKPVATWMQLEYYFNLY